MFGAFAAVHGRHATYSARLAMQTGVACLTAAVVLVSGVVSSSSPPGAVTSVYFGVVAGTGYLVARRFGWMPVPSVFLVFAAGAMTQATTDLRGVLVDAGAALTSGCLAAAVGQLGRFLPERERERHERATTRFRELVTRGIGRDLALYAGAPALAALTATALGMAHPSWAAVAATVPLAGTSVSAQLGRGIHRLLGTAAGVILSALVLASAPPHAMMFALVVAGMFAVELVIARHYGLASTLITPVALLMSELQVRSDLQDMVVTRVAETAMGVAVAAALILLLPHGGARQATGTKG
jgi:hypothetical protein